MNSEKQYKAALQALKNGQSPQALFLLEKAAQKKHSGALFKIGVMHQYGEVVEKDYDKALTFFKHSAELGYALAEEMHRRLTRQMQLENSEDVIKDADSVMLSD